MFSGAVAVSEDPQRIFRSGTRSFRDIRNELPAVGRNGLRSTRNSYGRNQVPQWVSRVSHIKFQMYVRPVFRGACGRLQSGSCYGSLNRELALAGVSQIPEGISATGFGKVRKRKCGNRQSMFLKGGFRSVAGTNSMKRTPEDCNERARKLSYCVKENRRGDLQTWNDF